MVTAISLVGARSHRIRSGAHHRRAALGMDIEDGSAEAARRLLAPATVLGMSCYLRSRKTGRPSKNGLHAIGSMGAEEFQAKLQAADRGSHGSGQLARAIKTGVVSRAT